MFSFLRELFRKRQPQKLSDWFFVTFDDDTIRISAKPLARSAWTQELAWNTIIRVCFQAEDLSVSDGIYVFTNQRPESYAIPIEASGGDELWHEIMRRNLFDAKLATTAMSSGEGLFCWPPKDEPAGS